MHAIALTAGKLPHLLLLVGPLEVERGVISAAIFLARAQLKLFVAGYTDTVGSHSANQSLSNNRARSIAQWYRQNGLRIPIYYQGFGEEVLAKPTPDETDEPANRRALYILSSQQPATSESLPRSKWRRL